MTEQNQKQLGNTLWSIADQLRGAMNADDFRDYMLSFLFLRYLSDNYEAAAKRELGPDYPPKTKSPPAYKTACRTGGTKETESGFSGFRQSGCSNCHPAATLVQKQSKRHCRI